MFHWFGVIQNTRALLLECWRSGQIDEADMVRMCREYPALEAALRASARDYH